MIDPGLRRYFQPDPGIVYLDAATFGLPPDSTVAALQHALATWQDGTANWIEDWDRQGDACRSLFAALIGAPEKSVALVPTVSVAAGMIAASLPPGSSVLVVEDEFTSMLLPFVVAAERREIQLRRVPFSDLATSIDTQTTLVAVSHVRSQDGGLLDLDAVVEQANRYGAKIALDATHSVPVIPIAPWIDQIDFLISHAYKQLLSPRGAGFFYVKQDNWDSIAPWFANWRSVQPVYGRSYGGGLSYDDSASRFDVALAWHSYAGARPSLELLLEWQRAGHLEWPVYLANRLADGLELPRTGSSIIAPRVPDADAAEESLTTAGVKAASRGGNIRLSPHVYNTIEEVDRAIEVVRAMMPAMSVS